MKTPTHVLTGEELSIPTIDKLLDSGFFLKRLRTQGLFQKALSGLQLALLFDKPSVRTRFSFTIAMRELGGDVVESLGNTRKTETPEDLAQVLGGYCHGIMVRTHHDADLARMAMVSSIPIINGLSDLHHPCQILSDLMTLNEVFGMLQGLTLSYIGDGNNILHSLLLLAPQMGVSIHYCCPNTRGPAQHIVEKSLLRLDKNSGNIKSFTTPLQAVTGAHAVYTDVWNSMGFETQSANHLFSGFQVNEQLMQHAHENAIFMHCLPMIRGLEVSETLPDQPSSVIFAQSENRLHIQKALLLHCLGENE